MIPLYNAVITGCGTTGGSMKDSPSLAPDIDSPVHEIVGPFFGINVSCCKNDGPCECGENERVLRAYMDGRHTVPMTVEQREWCLEEADAAGEGSYPKEEGINLSDAELAKWVLRAWVDYARSNVL